MSLSRVEAWKQFGDPDAWTKILAGVPMKRRKIMGERKLVKFGQIKVGATFWWAGKKWRRGGSNVAGRVARAVILHDRNRIFRDQDYVKISQSGL
jgi:hypothetical protein